LEITLPLNGSKRYRFIFVLQAPYCSAITASIDFLIELKRDLTLKYESPIYRTEAGKLGGQKAWRLRIIHPIKLPSFPASQPASFSKFTFL